MQAAILKVDNSLIVRWSRCLPPEHHLRAERRGERDTECLIVGPSLPEVAPGEVPPTITFLLTMHCDDDPIRYNLTGAFYDRHIDQPPRIVWPIGSWNTLHEARDWLDGDA